MAEELGLLIDGATSYAIYMLDPNGIVTIWNRGAERIKGWRSTEVVGHDFALFYTPEDVAAGKPQADLDRASAEGRVEEDCWRIRKDGSEFLASVTITALRDSAGALRGFGKVVRDITDQKAAETALARREHHLRSILETVPDAMIVIDEQGIISSFSAAAERLFGHAKADVIGRNVKMLMPEPDRRQHDFYLHHYRATGERKVIGRLRVVTGQRRSGETFQRRPIGDEDEDEECADEGAVRRRFGLHRIADLAIDRLDDQLQRGLRRRRHQAQPACQNNSADHQHGHHDPGRHHRLTDADGADVEQNDAGERRGHGAIALTRRTATARAITTPSAVISRGMVPPRIATPASVAAINAKRPATRAIAKGILIPAANSSALRHIAVK